MGHYASEMDPNWGAEIDATARRVKVRNKVDTMSLGVFTGADMPMLMRMYKLGGDLYRSDYVRLRELGILDGDN